MNCEKTFGFFRSSNEVNDVKYFVYTPVNCRPKAVVQLIHGMCEFSERYDDFADYLCSRGYIVCINDHIGHGDSVNNDDELGFFAEKNGWRYLVKDVLHLTKIMQEKYHSMPYFAIGHSMGSLVLRTILGKYSDIYDGAAIIGTISLDFGADACLAMIESVCRLRGPRFRSTMLNKMMFGMSNARIDNPETEYDWICTNMNIVRSYAENPKCTFIFTAQAMYDLVMMVKYVSAKDWSDKVRTDLPILIASGAEDPVGHYGKYPKDIFERLLKSGAEDIELKIYPEMRHEILNETEHLTPYNDICEWLDKHIGKAEN